jgi:SAM-dependent methyltransferase
VYGPAVPESQDRVWVASMSEAYEQLLVPTVFAPFAAPVAERVLAASPARVLEVAAGTGVLTRELVRRGAPVTATDLNDAMVAFGAGAVPEAAWQRADGMDLPFPDEAFDAVVCQFGAMFFPDRVTAFSEALRVLRPGGTVVLSVWDTLASHEFETAVVVGLQRALPLDPPTFLADVPHGCADPVPLLADLRTAGFVDATADRVVVTGHAPSAAALARGYCTGTPLHAALLARAADLDVVSQHVAAALAEALGDDPISGSMSAHLLEARRPV